MSIEIVLSPSDGHIFSVGASPTNRRSHNERIELELLRHATTSKCVLWWWYHIICTSIRTRGSRSVGANVYEYGSALILSGAPQRKSYTLHHVSNSAFRRLLLVLPARCRRELDISAVFLVNASGSDGILDGRAAHHLHHHTVRSHSEHIYTHVGPHCGMRLAGWLAGLRMRWRWTFHLRIPCGY